MQIIQEIHTPEFGLYVQARKNNPRHSPIETMRQEGFDPLVCAQGHPWATLLQVDIATFLKGIQALCPLELRAVGDAAVLRVAKLRSDVRGNEVVLDCTEDGFADQSLCLPNKGILVALRETTPNEVHAFHWFDHQGHFLLEILLPRICARDWWVILQAWADPLQDWSMLQKNYEIEVQ